MIEALRGTTRTRTRSAPGPFMLQGVGAPLEDRAREEPQPPRLRAGHALRRIRTTSGTAAPSRRCAASACRRWTASRSIPIEDEQPRYLAFLNKRARPPRRDAVRVHPPGAAQRQARARARRSRASACFRELQPEITYYAFNVEPKATRRPIRSAATRPERVALRRAMVLAHDRDAEIEHHPQEPGDRRRRRRCRPASWATTRISAPARRSYDPAKAKALLDMFGYVDRDGDGWREQPDGTPLVIRYKYNAGSQEYRQLGRAVVKSHGGRRASACEAHGGAVRRPAERQAASATPDGGLGLDRRLSRRAELPAAALRAQHRASPTSRASSCPSTTGSTRSRLALPDGPERNAALPRDEPRCCSPTRRGAWACTASSTTCSTPG